MYSVFRIHFTVLWDRVFKANPRTVPALLPRGYGCLCSRDNGPRLQATSKNQGGIFESEFRAQIHLIPSDSQTDPHQFPMSEVGELAVTFTDVPAFPSLWFCLVGGGPGQSLWKKIS